MDNNHDYFYAVLEHHGVNTMHSFDNRTEFKEWYGFLSPGHNVVYRGFSAKRAVRLSDCIDNRCRFAQFIRGKFK